MWEAGGCGTVLLQPEAKLLFLPSGQTIESNWRCGRHNLQRIQCRSENSKGVYCLQYDDEKIISGLRDNSIKVSTSLGPCPGCEWGSALEAACASWDSVWLVRVGCLSLAKSSPALCSGSLGHCQESHPLTTEVALKSVFPQEGGGLCVPLALAVAVSLPGLCFHAHPPWHFFGWTGFDLLMVLGCFSLFSQKLTSRLPKAKGKDKAHWWDRLTPHGVWFFAFAAVTMFKSWSMFLTLIWPFLFLTDLGQNKLGMFESIDRTYWLSSLSAIWWKSYCNWIFRFYSEVSVKFLYKNNLTGNMAGNIFNDL